MMIPTDVERLRGGRHPAMILTDAERLREGRFSAGKKKGMTVYENKT